MAETKLSNSVDTKVDYQALEKQRAEMLQNQLKQQLRALEVGKNSSLRRIVLRFVVEGQYTEAAATIDEYINIKKIYPSVVERSDAHAIHAKELINAIRAKRNFPNLSQLAMSKQQEILDNAIAHFEELRATLKAIEYIVRDEGIKDIRSTVWVLRSLVYTVTGVIVTIFMHEFTETLGRPLWIVFNDFAIVSFRYLTKVLPFL